MMNLLGFAVIQYTMNLIDFQMEIVKYLEKEAIR